MTDPAGLIDRYLQLCEDRELGTAAQFLSHSVRIQFPSGETYGSLAELVGAPKAYTWVRKRRERYFVAAEGDATVVTSVGRLYGERLDGTPFDDVRYVDVFVLRDGLITEQLVWNDLCESGIRAAASRDAEASVTPGTGTAAPATASLNTPEKH